MKEQFFATIRWTIEDVQNLRPEWTEEQARAWWIENERFFRETLTEYGNEILANALT